MEQDIKTFAQTAGSEGAVRWKQLFSLPEVRSLKAGVKIVYKCHTCGHMVSLSFEESECEACLEPGLSEWVESKDVSEQGWLTELWPQKVKNEEHEFLLRLVRVIRRSRPLQPHEDQLFTPIEQYVRREIEEIRRGRRMRSIGSTKESLPTLDDLIMLSKTIPRRPVTHKRSKPVSDPKVRAFEELKRDLLSLAPTHAAPVEPPLGEISLKRARSKSRSKRKRRKRRSPVPARLMALVSIVLVLVLVLIIISAR